MKKHIIFGYIIFVITLVAAFSLSKVYYSSHSAEVSFEIAPQEAKVSVGSLTKTVSSGDTLLMKPGTYPVKIEKDGFIEYTETVDITPNHTNIIGINLAPQTSAAKEELDDKRNVAARQGIADLYIGQQSNDASNNLEYSFLPYKNFLFSLSYRQQVDMPNEPYIITIDAPDIYKSSALHYLSSQGITLSDFTYEFIGYTNPFIVRDTK